MRLLFFFFLIIFSFNLFSQEEIKLIKIQQNTLDTSLIKQNADLFQNTLDIIFLTPNHQIIFGGSDKSKNLETISITIIKSKNEFYGEVLIRSQDDKNYAVSEEFHFTDAKFLIPEARIAIARALLGNEYVVRHLEELKADANKKLNLPLKKVPEAIPATAKTQLVTNPNIKSEPTQIYQSPPAPTDANKNISNKNSNEIKKNVSDRKNESTQSADTNILPTKQKQSEIKLPESNINLTKTQPIKKTNDKVANVEIEKYVYHINFLGTVDKRSNIVNSGFDIKSNFITTGFGANIIYRFPYEKIPYSLFGELQIHQYINRGVYNIPFSKMLDFKYTREKSIYGHDLILGLTYDTTYFIAIPYYGSGLQYIENNLVWFNLGSQTQKTKSEYYLLDDTYFRFLFYKSILGGSNFDSLKINSYRFSLDYFKDITSNISIKLNYNYETSKAKNSSNISIQNFGLTAYYNLM